MKSEIKIAATMWIRDGVLVDRMHLNPVAFAYAFYLSLESAQQKLTNLAQLVNFALAKSGMSCLEKMRLFNLEVADVLADAEIAAHLYNEIATEAARATSYFAEAIETLSQLQASGTKNFITSAVEQQALDEWLAGEQGLQIAPLLQETLGRRENFSKGADHFRYVSEAVSGAPVYYIADAELEIAQAAGLAKEFNLVPIGFAHFIGVEQIQQAEKFVRTACDTVMSQWQPAHTDAIDCNQLILPPQETIRAALANAGAVAVVDDFTQLRNYLF